MKRKLKELANEMFDRQITWEDIENNEKTKGVADMLQKTGTTYAELALAQQMYRAAYKADLKSLEFLRDTAGQKPTEKIEQTVKNNDYDSIPLGELERRLELYKELEKSHEKISESEGDDIDD